jgi:hypothetical protein
MTLVLPTPATPVRTRHVVSSTARGVLEGSGIQLVDTGEHELKGLPGARMVFRVEP